MPTHKSATQIMAELDAKDSKAQSKINRQIAKIEASYQSKSPKTKYPTVYIRDLLSSLKTFPDLYSRTDKRGSTVIHTKDNKVLSYAYQTQKGISYYTRQNGHWVLSSTKIVDKKSLVSFLNTLHQSED